MSYSYENKKIDSYISTANEFNVSKTTDYFLDIIYKYPSGRWKGCIPLVARYQNFNVVRTEATIQEYAKRCYQLLHPSNNQSWQDAQRKFWDSKNSIDTEAVFNALNNSGDITIWQCRKCGPVASANPQPASRIRELKKFGYFIATKRQYCPNCGSSQYFDILIRLPRIDGAEVTKRYGLSVELDRKIKSVLTLKDACSGQSYSNNELIIDHKFPSARWINGETKNFNEMSDAEIQEKFQLLTNQNNLLKAKYCDRCVQSGKRGEFFGIKWYYAGNETWNGSASEENGCIGCCWYDTKLWKATLNESLNNENN